MKFKNFLNTCIAFSMISCAGVKKNSLTSKVDWLIGTWENNTAGGTLHETWSQVSESELAGKSYLLKNRDTILLEDVQLITRNNIPTYIPTVQGQNNEKPVVFPMVRSSRSKLVFQNKSHDFPQVISYTRISKDSLLAEISGINKGLAKRQIFPMRRIK